MESIPWDKDKEADTNDIVPRERETVNRNGHEMLKKTSIRHRTHNSPSWELGFQIDDVDGSRK